MSLATVQAAAHILLDHGRGIQFVADYTGLPLRHIHQLALRHPPQPGPDRGRGMRHTLEHADVVEQPPRDDNDLDQVNVQIAATGRPVQLTRAERLEVVRRLHGQGLNDRQIAARLDVHTSAVQYIRAKALGLPPVTGRGASRR